MMMIMMMTEQWCWWTWWWKCLMFGARHYLLCESLAGLPTHLRTKMRGRSQTNPPITSPAAIRRLLRLKWHICDAFTRSIVKNWIMVLQFDLNHINKVPSSWWCWRKCSSCRWWWIIKGIMTHRQIYGSANALQVPPKPRLYWAAPNSRDVWQQDSNCAPRLLPDAT